MTRASTPWPYATQLSRRRLPMRWMAFCNPVGFDAEVARAMAQAGCEALEFGLDAATLKMLAALAQTLRAGGNPNRSEGGPRRWAAVCGASALRWAWGNVGGC